jgi:Mrp family chromosome partitioning ATPase
VIPAGAAVPNAADLLMSQQMQDLIGGLRGEFDYIVIDTPPLLPVVDALALATVADKVLLIVEWGRTPFASISEAFKVLRPEAHRVAGIILNKVDLRQLQRYGYRGSVDKFFSNA